VISEEAIGAACDVSAHLDITTSDIRTILEAAAPHLMAEAWDQGRRAWDDYDDDNPYRAAK